MTRQAFTKRDRKPTTDLLDGSKETTSNDVSTSSGDGKKPTEWFLEPWAVNGGVESTTRYRNPTRRSGSSSRNSPYPSKGDGLSTAKKSARLRTRRADFGSGGASAIHMSPHYLHHLAPRHHLPPVSGLPMIADASSYRTTLVGYSEYSDPQVYSTGHLQHHHHQRHVIPAAPSESGVDEPTTPEQSYAEASLLLPDPRVTATSSSSVGGYYLPTRESHGSLDSGDLPAYAFPSAGSGTVGVYDEVVDRYSGWVGGVEETATAAAYQAPHY